MDRKSLRPSSSIPMSQAIFSSLLEEYFDIMQEICTQGALKYVAPPLKLIHDHLTGIHAELEGLALTHHWTLQEMDLELFSKSTRGGQDAHRWEIC